MAKDKYLLLYSDVGLYADAYDTYEDAYKAMITKFERTKESIEKTIYEPHQLVWLIDGYSINKARLETLDGKYTIQWKIIKLNEEGQIQELSLY